MNISKMMKKYYLIITVFVFLMGNPVGAQIVINPPGVPHSIAGTAVPITCPGLPFVKINNGKLQTLTGCQYMNFLVKGVAYEPAPIGWHPEFGYSDIGDPRPDNIYDDDVILQRDFALLDDLGANTVRIYAGNDGYIPSTGQFPMMLTTKTLDYAKQHQIKVAPGFFMPWPGEVQCQETSPGVFQAVYVTYTDYTNPAIRQDLKNRFVTFVNTFKNHPAILFWVIGNENDFAFSPDLPASLVQMQAYFSLIQEMAQAAHAAEGTNKHPVATVLGNRAFIGQSNFGTADNQMPDLDIWGLNAYTGNSFGTLFDDVDAKTNKPLWIAEFGLDAFNAMSPSYPGKGFVDEQTQAQWTVLLWQEIASAYQANKSIGGTVFEYSDEWWKPYQWQCGTQSPACNSEQNHFGFGPTDTSCPKDGTLDSTLPSQDGFFHEQFWGITTPVADANDPSAPDTMTVRKVYLDLKNSW
jgi:hypothetical protein